MHTHTYTCTHTYFIPACRCLRIDTGWRRCIRCLIIIDYFPQNNTVISVCFAEKNLQLKASDASSPFCTNTCTNTNVVPACICDRRYTYTCTCTCTHLIPACRFHRIAAALHLFGQFSTPSISEILETKLWYVRVRTYVYVYLYVYIYICVYIYIYIYIYI